MCAGQWPHEVCWISESLRTQLSTIIDRKTKRLDNCFFGFYGELGRAGIFLSVFPFLFISIDYTSYLKTLPLYRDTTSDVQFFFFTDNCQGGCMHHSTWPTATASLGSATASTRRTDLTSHVQRGLSGSLKAFGCLWTFILNLCLFWNCEGIYIFHCYFSFAFFLTVCRL